MSVESPAQVLPIVRKQLEDIARLVEENVGAVCRDFGEMAQLANRNVDVGGTGDGHGSEQRHVEHLIEEAERTVERMRLRQQRSAAMTTHVAKGLESTRGQMAKLSKVMSEVMQIAVGTRLLSVNSRIEAAHLGEQGRAFAIVADEMARLSHYTQALTGRIERVVLDVERQLDGITAEMGDVSEEIVDSRAIENVLLGLREAHRDMEHSLEASGERAKELGARITSAVMALQFQDRLSQRVGHVCAALQLLERWGGADGTAGDLAAAAEQLLRDSYSMQEERIAHTQAAKGAPVAAGTQEDGDVELF